MAAPRDDRVVRDALAIQRRLPCAEGGLLGVGGEQQDAQVDALICAAVASAGRILGPRLRATRHPRTPAQAAENVSALRRATRILRS
jgi:hypothetical protein